MGKISDFAPIAQEVERSAVNRKVGGSIPPGSGFFTLTNFLIIGFRTHKLSGKKKLN